MSTLTWTVGVVGAVLFWPVAPPATVEEFGPGAGIDGRPWVVVLTAVVARPGLTKVTGLEVATQ